MNRLSRSRGFILMEVVTAAALIALVSVTLFFALTGSLKIFRTAKAVTRGRLLAASHLALAQAGKANQWLVEDKLVSVLTFIEGDGFSLWQVEVSGGDLPQPLVLVGGP